jgi:hypothetical protein
MERRAKVLKSLPALFFATTLVVTVVIFASRGTNFNHLLDAEVAAIVLLTWLAVQPIPLQRKLGTWLLALTTLTAVIPLLRKPAYLDQSLPPYRFQAVLARIGKTEKPILSENPIIPALAGQSPWVLDSWMLQLLRRRDFHFGDPLLDELQKQSFAAVVLCPRKEFGSFWYGSESFGSGFESALLQNYRLASAVGDQMIYLPVANARQEIRKEGLPGAHPLLAAQTPQIP